MRPATRRNLKPELVTLEERTLLSLAPALDLAATHPHAELARHPRFTTNPAGVAAILSAINGGAGHEFVTLIRKEVHNLPGVILGFETGRITQYTIPGMVAKIPNLQPAYAGPAFDRMALTLGGAVLLKGGRLELGAVTRGAFFASNATSTVVFGLNRGQGAKLGPIFPARPGITPDLLVTVTIAPYAQSYSGQVQDLVTGATTPLAASQIQVDGPTVRVFLNLNQTPSEGFKIPKYHFAVWTDLLPAAGIATVGSFVPESQMIPIGLLGQPPRPRPRRR